MILCNWWVHVSWSHNRHVSDHFCVAVTTATDSQNRIYASQHNSTSKHRGERTSLSSRGGTPSSRLRSPSWGGRRRATLVGPLRAGRPGPTPTHNTSSGKNSTLQRHLPGLHIAPAIGERLAPTQTWRYAAPHVDHRDGRNWLPVPIREPPAPGLACPFVSLLVSGLASILGLYWTHNFVLTNNTKLFTKVRGYVCQYVGIHTVLSQLRSSKMWAFL